MTNEDFGLDNSFSNSIDFGSLRFSPQNRTNFESGASLTRHYTREVETNLPGNFPERSTEELPQLIQQLHSDQPLRCSGNQRQLARQALTALKNRQPQEMRNLINNLVNDVASIVD